MENRHPNIHLRYRASVMSGSDQHRGRIRFWLLIVVLHVSTCCGCGRPSDGPPTFPVHGKLLIDGQPAMDAQVIFHPAAGKNFDQRGARPTGKVGADGGFTLTTYHLGDGAPAGEYSVAVYWARNPTSLEPSPDRLNGRFLDPARSSLNVAIPERPTELAPFLLKTR